MVDASRPVLYYQDEEFERGGVRRRRTSFLWFRAGEEPRGQGLRTTFDEEGFPVLFEVLQDGGGPGPLFASTDLEEAARRANGPAPEGRLHALETELDPPHVPLVALLDSAPAAMGPYVYQAVEGEDLWTVHCRCSPTQASEIVDSIDVDLVPLEELSGLWPRAGDPSFRPTEEVWSALRLPPDWTP